jgi:hypothetical protein
MNEQNQEIIEKRRDLTHAAKEVLNALAKFETFADLPAYSYAEDEIIAIRKKMTEMFADPAGFVREMEDE